MGLYDFKPQFVAKILAGEKTHTIRATRANPDKPGNTLHLYTGLRQKGARLLMRVECTRVEEITIREEYVCVDGVILHDDELELLCRRDGFPNSVEFMRFWEGRLPFTGHIYHWRKP
jgi:hypothetical protein